MPTLDEIRAVPKVLLHDHLDGGLRPQTVLELARETGYDDLPADNAEELTQRLPDHYLIIDTPPCMASSDAAALAPLVGQIVFVVEANNTQQGEIQAALSTLSTCPRISLLLNKSDSLATEHFGSYGYNYHSSDSGSDEQRSAETA